MRTLRRLAIVVPLVSILLASAPGGQRSLLARGGAPAGQRAHDSRPSPPDPCELALTPRGEANGLHQRCESAGSAGVARGDFNGDGLADLAVGVPYEDLDGINAAGIVQVFYGSASGLTATGDQLLDIRTFGFPLGSDDHFGWALAAGDFNGDGNSDLAISAPDYEASGTANDGVVFVIEGTDAGLNAGLTSTVGLGGSRGRAGAALAWGDFNSDDIGDLAVGIPDAEVRGEGIGCSQFAFDVTNAGEVRVLYGSGNGLGDFGGQRLIQGLCDRGSTGEGVGDSIEEGDRFGASLTVLRGGTGDDLVIGAPLEDLGLFDKIDAGVVHVVRGLSGGLYTNDAFVLSQDTAGVGGGAESGDQFGRVLASGNFNGIVGGSALADLVVSVPFEDLSSNGQADAGAVHVFPDINDIADAANSLFISQADLAGVSVEAGDRFGWAVAAGDFNNDGYDELAIGSPGEDVGALADAGLVAVISGSSTGLRFSTARILTQDTAGIADVAEPGDQFGYALSAWNFGVSAHRDLAIGAPFEDLTSTVTGTLMQDAGAVHVLYGSSTGVATTGSQFWTQDSAGVLDSVQVGDRFGNSLY
jgi:FG-GAP repeat